MVASMLSVRLPGFDNGLLHGACAGAIGGGVGAMVVAAVLALIVPMLSPFRVVLIVPLAGACFGALFMFCGIYLSDHTPLGHPFDDIVAFPLWQTGVAASIPFCLRSSSTDEVT